MQNLALNYSENLILAHLTQFMEFYLWIIQKWYSNQVFELKFAKNEKFNGKHTFFASNDGI